MRELLALAAANGESKATLKSPQEAELFRFAVYRFRQAEGLGQDILLTLDGNVVIATKRPEVDIVIGSEPTSLPEGA